MNFKEQIEQILNEGLDGDKQNVKLQRELGKAFTADELTEVIPMILELEPTGNVPSGNSNTAWTAYWKPRIAKYMIKNKMTIKQLKKEVEIGI